MNYATVADMVARFGELEVMQITDRNQDNQIDHDVAEVALADATAEINGYLGRYPLPFVEVPPILTRLCCDIARYRLCATNGVSITEEIERRYKIDVLKLLEGLAKGDVTLGIEADGDQVASGDTVQFVNNKNRVFARDN
ncbi:gp436 family protein [Snodgrassella sp. CFCC 13594]|uniref:gp436 family protein n=1 Tax=Snodgrassella sp. CFCC 13594 TaxID=1775559 RepID=UPI00082EA22B|nr:phage protein Gp36 family protein [Snodgrassella sp. CFCC 13594]